MSVYEHPEWRALVAEICARPADDLPRLVAADFLDEHGEGERAEFVRVQCEIAKWQPHFDDHQPGPTKQVCHECFEFVRLRRRERELWAGVAGIEFARLSVSLGQVFECRLDVLTGYNPGPPQIIVRRGFPAEVRGTLAVLWGERCFCTTQMNWPDGNCSSCHGTGRTSGVLDRLEREHPLEVVRATDREPWENDGEWSWFSVDHFGHPPSVIPESIHLRMAREWGDFTSPQCSYPTPELAHAALSSALLAAKKTQPITPPAAPPPPATAGR